MSVIDTGNYIGNKSLTALPNQLVDDYDDNTYISTARFIASRWNQPVYVPTRWSLDAKEIGMPLGFATRCMIWRDYYFGIQRNWNYNYTNINSDGSRLLVKTFRGKDIFKYVNYTIEPIIEITKRIPKIIQCNIVSEEIVSRKRLFNDVANFMFNQQDMADYMNEKYVAYLRTPNGEKFLKNASTELGSVDFRENYADAAVNVARDTYYRNYLGEQFIEGAKDALITGLIGMHIKIENGYPLVERIPSHEAIFSPASLGDQHRNDAYGGRLRFMTVQEVAAKFGTKLGKERLEEIQKIAFSGMNLPMGYYGWDYYNNTVGSPTFNWYSNVDGVPRIAVLECQWASYMKDDSEEYRQCLRETTMIGNKYLIDAQVSTNITKDWKNPANTDLDFMFCQPMSVYGKNMGIPEILCNYQDRVDFLQTKLDHWVNQTKGTFYLINGSYLDEGVDAAQVVSDIADMRVHVVKGMDTDAGEQVQKFMQQGAIEMPRDIVSVINQIGMYRQMMSDILNIPDAARGIIEGYVPQKTLNAQISQSGKGTKYFYDPLFTFYNRVMQKVVDKFKYASLDNEGYEYALVVSDTQSELFKSTKEFGTTKFSIYLGFEDVADEGYKQSMMNMVFAYAQNPQSGYTLSDADAIQTMYTRSEIRNYLQAREFAIKQERLAAEQRAAEMAMAQQQQNNQTMLESAAINNMGASERQQMNLESKESIEAAKLAMKEQEMAQE